MKEFIEACIQIKKDNYRKLKHLLLEKDKVALIDHLLPAYYSSGGLSKYKEELLAFFKLYIKYDLEDNPKNTIDSTTKELEKTLSTLESVSWLSVLEILTKRKHEN